MPYFLFNSMNLTSSIFAINLLSFDSALTEIITHIPLILNRHHTQINIPLPAQQMEQNTDGGMECIRLQQNKVLATCSAKLVSHTHTHTHKHTKQPLALIRGGLYYGDYFATRQLAAHSGLMAGGRGTR
jgi:hypothetical protein